MIRLAADRSRLLKIRSGISACLLRASINTNETSRITEAASDTTTFVSPQWLTPLGLVAALERPYTSRARPRLAVIARGASRASTMPIGTLTKNTHRQDA